MPSMAWWRLRWGKLGDAVAELSSLHAELEQDQSEDLVFNQAAYVALSEELRKAETELAAVKRLVREMRKQRDQAAVRR